MGGSPLRAARSSHSRTPAGRSSPIDHGKRWCARRMNANAIGCQRATGEHVADPVAARYAYGELKS